MHQPNRREVLKWSALLAGAYVAGPAILRAAEEKPRKVLFFTKSSGFQHSVIDRHGKDELAYAEKILIDLGKPHGMEITASKDGGLFTPEKLAEFDAFVFYTTGNLDQPGTDKQPPMPPTGKQALLDAVKGGKGFIGLHCGSDTFHSNGTQIDPYIQMLGGEFQTHGAQQDSTVTAIDPQFPGINGRKEFSTKEEWYALKNFNKDIHVIFLQQTKGMKGPMYQRPPYPSTWARMHGSGRVFYSSMAHREETWVNPFYQGLLIGALSWVTGNVEAVTTPNLEQVTADTTQPAQ